MESSQSEGRKLHQLALQSQEKKDFLAALKYEEEAMMAYFHDKDDLGFSEIQSMRFLTLKLIFEETGEKKFMILAKHQAMVGVELAEMSGNEEALAVPLFNLAKVYETLEDNVQASEIMERAVKQIETEAPEMYRRPAIVADFKVHLGVFRYKAGKTKIDEAETALSQLADADEKDTYSKNVWLSGGHMRIAEAVATENRKGAENHMQEAKKIIDSDERLKLRLEQWQKLMKKLDL